MQCVCRIYAVGGRNEGLRNDLPTKDSPRPRREAQGLGPKQAHIELLHLQGFCDLLVLQLNLRVGHCLKREWRGRKLKKSQVRKPVKPVAECRLKLYMKRPSGRPMEALVIRRRRRGERRMENAVSRAARLWRSPDPTERLSSEPDSRFSSVDELNLNARTRT